MPIYVTLSQGPRADLARPILASSDQRVVGAVLQSLARLDQPEDEADRSGDRARRPASEVATACECASVGSGQQEAPSGCDLPHQDTGDGHDARR